MADTPTAARADRDLSAPVLLTGATGFVGRTVDRLLTDAGVNVARASRHPAKAARAHASDSWRRLDVDDAATLGPALMGCRAAIYLIHSLGRRDFARVEVAQAERFARAARSRDR